MNKFLKTYLTNRKKTYINIYDLRSNNEYKYYDFSDLNLSTYKLTKSIYDPVEGQIGWWLKFSNDKLDYLYYWDYGRMGCSKKYNLTNQKFDINE